jgi:hypothetical protein
MSDPTISVDAEVHAFLAAQRMLDVQRYLERGRALKDRSDAELAQLFKAAFAAFVENHTDHTARRNFDDAQAEFDLRGSSAPLDDPDVADTRKAMLDLVKRTDAEQSPEERARHAEELGRGISEALGHGRTRS